jgi:hypothetical protein
MDAGDHPGELAKLLAVVAGDLSELRHVIREMARADVDGLLEAAMRRASVVASFGLRGP